MKRVILTGVVVLAIIPVMLSAMLGSVVLARAIQVPATPTLVPSPEPPTATLPVTPATPIPTNTRRPTVTPTPTLPSTPARTRISTNVPGPFGGDLVTWTPPAPGPRFPDHYLMGRPISSAFVNYWARNYSYGSSDNGNRPVHHGIDIPNETGTPVIAAADGIVYFVGSDQTILFGPQPDFYGTLVVIEHTFRDSRGLTIYSLYGHLYKVEVRRGQPVKEGQVIGQVGSSGVALGAHLHFEVRAGDPQDYNATRNPELWIIPFQGYGVLAGRVLDLNGKPLGGLRVEAQAPATYRFGYSYVDNTVHSDPAFGENFVIPDLPSGYYNVLVKWPEGGLRFKTMVYIRAGRTNWIDIHINNAAR